ncbi:hypothetical protein M408DRAFT_64307 [Serendipita vermifera MAFF 305830]|uniref:SHSP domain-containing protein n=1 Tax=Serendipita vermifera MAFF 305830 TaxID=933852 RepID=A0A0C2X164_SERVB|nr:hypothetical protein M408DRAFT_64307 [Serendipita vermifera MAFF 305830]
MNIQQTGNTYTITVELPGLQKEQVDISVAEGVLTISGEFAMNLNTSTPSGHDGFVLRERRFGPFKRSVRLPTWVNVDTIKATMAHGVLSLVIEKPQEGDKPAKKISVF